MEDLKRLDGRFKWVIIFYKSVNFSTLVITIIDFGYFYEQKKKEIFCAIFLGIKQRNQHQSKV